MTLSRRSSSLHEIAAALDHVEDVEAFFVMADFVGELAAAAEGLGSFGFFERAAHAPDNLFDLRLQIGDLLLGRVGPDDVDQFVRACHSVSLWICLVGASRGRWSVRESGDSEIRHLQSNLTNPPYRHTDSDARPP